MPNISTDQAVSWTYWPFRGFEDPEPAGGAQNDPATGDGTETETSGDPATTPPTGEPKTFTQEEVNALITRETQKASRGKLDPKELGFSSKDELKTFLQKMKDKSEAEKSEEEKEREAKLKEAVEAARNDVLSKANSRLVKSEFIIAASKAGVSIPMDDAFQVAQTLEEYAPEVDDEKGTVSGFDDDFFKAFKSAKPYVFAKSGAGDIGAGASGGGPDKTRQREAELRETYPALGRQMTAAEAAGIRPR